VRQENQTGNASLPLSQLPRAWDRFERQWTSSPLFSSNDGEQRYSRDALVIYDDYFP
jgi:hypothetical protein